jgi:hypothetical protein
LDRVGVAVAVAVGVGVVVAVGVGVVVGVGVGVAEKSEMSPADVLALRTRICLSPAAFGALVGGLSYLLIYLLRSQE